MLSLPTLWLWSGTLLQNFSSFRVTCSWENPKQTKITTLSASRWTHTVLNLFNLTIPPITAYTLTSVKKLRCSRKILSPLVLCRITASQWCVAIRWWRCSSRSGGCRGEWNLGSIRLVGGEREIEGGRGENEEGGGRRKREGLLQLIVFCLGHGMPWPWCGYSVIFLAGHYGHSPPWAQASFCLDGWVVWWVPWRSPSWLRWPFLDLWP